MLTSKQLTYKVMTNKSRSFMPEMPKIQFIHGRMTIIDDYANTN